jgi:hypothetical protein
MPRRQRADATVRSKAVCLTPANLLDGSSDPGHLDRASGRREILDDCFTDLKTHAARTLATR